MSSHPKASHADEPRSRDRRSVLIAAAWAAPAIAVATVTPLAAATAPPGTGWVAAVRAGAPLTETEAKRPGFRFSAAGPGASVISCVVAYSSANGNLTFGQIFTGFGGSWSLVKTGPVSGVYTYTATQTGTAGPLAFSNGPTPPPGGNSIGITVKLPGQYYATVTPNDGVHASATLSAS